MKSIADLVNPIDRIAYRKASELTGSNPVGPSSDDFSIADAKQSKSPMMDSVTS